MTVPSIDAPRRPGALDAVSDIAAGLAANRSKVIKGKPEALRMATVALVSGYHLLLEDVPGVGKTLLAKALARSLGGSFRRVQGTPDLLPAEVTGVSVFHKDTEEWHFRPGPLFANVVLVDEINRATPRTQSALLEAMEERQVTVDGETWALPEPFFVVATQNPVEHAGTFPLVEGQRDRFGLVIELGHPHRSAERELLLGAGGAASLDDLVPVCGPAQLAAATAAVRAVFCAATLADYVIDLCAGTREHADVVLGASARASLSLLHAAKASAAMTGRDYVTPGDIQAVAVASLAHRLVLAGGTDLAAASALVRGLVDTVAVPRH